LSHIALSIVAPCYNEEETLPEFLRRTTAVCESLELPYEIILVNDGSRDNTWRALLDLSAQYPRLTAVNLSRNHGHQLALTAGLHICRGERVLIIDADLQDPPELLPEMMRVMDGEEDGTNGTHRTHRTDGAGEARQQAEESWVGRTVRREEESRAGKPVPRVDVVYAQRRRREGETPFKRFTASLFYRLIGRLTDVPIPPDTGDFRLISRRALDVLLAMPERHRFIRGMLSWIGFRQVPILYDRDRRFAGESSYPFRKMLRFAIDAVTSFSIRPLLWASTIGFLAALAAAGLFVYSLLSWLLYKTAPGWASIMAGVAFLGSIQLFVLGIFGEYLGRLYDQAKGRPLFIIESIVTGGETGAPPAAVGAAPEVVVRPVAPMSAESRVPGPE
jgi:dolichol-phosphate mannosyltransferase